MATNGFKKSRGKSMLSSLKVIVHGMCSDVFMGFVHGICSWDLFMGFVHRSVHRNVFME